MAMHHSVMDTWSDKKKEIFKKINENEIFHRLVILLDKESSLINIKHTYISGS